MGFGTQNMLIPLGIAAIRSHRSLSVFAYRDFATGVR